MGESQPALWAPNSVDRVVIESALLVCQRAGEPTVSVGVSRRGYGTALFADQEIHESTYSPLHASSHPCWHRIFGTLWWPASNAIGADHCDTRGERRTVHTAGAGRSAGTSSRDTQRRRSSHASIDY